MDEIEKCGIVMPISALDGCSENHWGEVQVIISDAITKAGFEPNLVSQSEDIGIIQKRIVENLYYNPVVVCDVSGKNANVMFELGMRLAFDKATIIIKDDKTSYSFDTSPIEHLEYPRDLRYASIVDFKEKLATKIAATNAAAKKDKNYSTFLKHFGEFKVTKLEQKEVSAQEFILDELKQLRGDLRSSNVSSFFSGNSLRRNVSDYNFCLSGIPNDQSHLLQKELLDVEGVADVFLENRGKDHSHVHVSSGPNGKLNLAEIRSICEVFKNSSRSERKSNKSNYGTLTLRRPSN